MIPLEILGLYLFLLISVCIAGHQIPHGYMTVFYYNRRQVVVNDSYILELSNRFLPADRKDYLTCDIDIVTSPNRRLMIHFESLEIAEEKEFLDRLHIYDYRNGKKVRISPIQGLYGLYNKYYNSASGVADYKSTGNKLKLDYQGMPTLEYNGFKILITSFIETRNACGSKFTRCDYNDVCVPLSTKCDGYNNCGSNDSGDESACNYGLDGAWKPWDGRITAVVAASVSCGLFFLSAAIIIIVVMKINKREIINNTNITVEFRKKRKKKRNEKRNPSNGEMLTRLYAPPSYEVVIGMDEDPPPYQAVADGFETASETEDDESVLDDHVIQSENFSCSPMPIYSEKESENCDTVSSNIRIHSALVTCDIDGNNVNTSDVCSVDEPIQNKSNEVFEEMTKYKPLPCNGSSSSLRKVTVIDNDPNEIEVLEHHSSSEDVTSGNEHVCQNGSINNGVITNGKIANGDNHMKGSGLSNGVNHVEPNSKLIANGGKRVGNGTTKNRSSYSKVMFKRSPSKREPDSIEYVDSD
ncbi:hypothetical protein ACF0H5_015108 [Mactra antiquata]